MEPRGWKKAEHGGAYGESLDRRIPRYAKGQNVLALGGGGAGENRSVE